MSIKKIVVPTDFSENSLQALARAQEFAQRFGAEIVLVHVLEAPVYPTTVFGAGAAHMTSIREEMLHNVTAQLERLAASQPVSARAVVREGTPFLEIIDVATDEKADLIVISTHGHTGIKHMLLGSVAEKIVRKSPCPVLTVRTHGEG